MFIKKKAIGEEFQYWRCKYVIHILTKIPQALIVSIVTNAQQSVILTK